jgi:tetratricopeptide (TPR) repeat protein
LHHQKVSIMKKRALIVLLIAICGSFALAAALIAPRFSADKNAEKAAVEAMEIPRLLPRNAQLGTAEERSKVAEMFDRSNAVLKTKPTDIKALLTLAEVYMNEARVTGEHPYYYPAALQMLDRVLTAGQIAKDQVYQAMYMKASVQLSLHQFDRALITGEEAARLNPYDAGIFGVLVDANVELGNYAKAIEMSDKMVGIRPDLRSYSRISYLRELHGEVKGAFEALNMAVDAGYPGYEQSAWCRVTLGNLYERYGELDQAAMHYQLTLQDRPDFPFAISGLASVEAKRGNQAEAIRLLDQASKIIPEVGFTLQKARLLKESGQEAEAKRLAEESMVMMQEDTEKGHKMDLELAHVYLDLLDNPRTAIQFAQTEYAMRPKNIDVNKVLAAAYYQLNDLTQATNHIAAARATGTHDPETLLIAGLILHKSGSPKEGKTLLKEAFQQNPYLKGALAKEALPMI